MPLSHDPIVGDSKILTIYHKCPLLILTPFCEENKFILNVHQDNNIPHLIFPSFHLLKISFNLSKLLFHQLLSKSVLLEFKKKIRL